MFPLLDYATPLTVQTWGNNIKFILPHCSKDVFKHTFLTHCTQGLECAPTISSGSYILGPVQGQPPKCYIIMLHWTVFILHWVVVFVLFIKCTFSLLFLLFCPTCLIVSIDSLWLMEDRDRWGHQSQRSPIWHPVADVTSHGSHRLQTMQIKAHNSYPWRVLMSNYLCTEACAVSLHCKTYKSPAHWHSLDLVSRRVEPLEVTSNLDTDQSCTRWSQLMKLFSLLLFRVNSWEGPQFPMNQVNEPFC